MSLGDIYEFKLSTAPPNVGDEALNLFYYEHIAGTLTDLEEVFEVWDGAVGLALRNIQSFQVPWNYCQVRNLFSLTEFLDKVFDPSVTHGLLAENSAPPSTVVNYTLRRASRVVRNGAKRFSGIANNQSDRGFIDDVGYLALLNTLREQLAVSLMPLGDAWEMQPVIVKRVKELNPDYPLTSKYEYIYRLPENPSEKIVSALSGVAFSQFTSTQVTRKSNR